MIGPDGRLIKDFAEAKQYALKWLAAPKQVDSRGLEYPLDENVIPLVKKLNEELTFLYTWASCGGHFNSRADILARYPGVPEQDLHCVPCPGYVSCFGGYVDFCVDGSENGERFLRLVERLLADYPDAGLRSSPDRHDYTLLFTRAHVTEDPDACTEAEAVMAKRQIAQLMEKLSALCGEFK